jgi:hypothetical protein
MRKLVLLLLGLFLLCNIFSQDLVIKKNGTLFYCKIVKEDSARIFVRFDINGLILNSSIDKKEVETFRYNYLEYERFIQDSIDKKSNLVKIKSSKDHDYRNP